MRLWLIWIFLKFYFSVFLKFSYVCILFIIYIQMDYVIYCLGSSSSLLYPQLLRCRLSFTCCWEVLKTDLSLLRPSSPTPATALHWAKLPLKRVVSSRVTCPSHRESASSDCSYRTLKSYPLYPNLRMLQGHPASEFTVQVAAGFLKTSLRPTFFLCPIMVLSFFPTAVNPERPL